MTATSTPGRTADPDPVDEFIAFGSTKTGGGTRDAPSRRGWLVAVAIVLAAAMGFGGARLTDTAPRGLLLVANSVRGAGAVDIGFGLSRRHDLEDDGVHRLGQDGD
jgi:hypothetical protein